MVDPVGPFLDRQAPGLVEQERLRDAEYRQVAMLATLTAAVPVL
ncbi:hypothetical protein ACTWPB_21500 [Nocardia sp. IBHARD005]